MEPCSYAIESRVDITKKIEPTTPLESGRSFWKIIVEVRIYAHPSIIKKNRSPTRKPMLPILSYYSIVERPPHKPKKI